MTFDDIADERMMSSAKGRLGELTWDVEPHAYQRLTVPEQAPLEPLLKLLARRTLDPVLASRLLEVFPDRPMERALIAYDIAADSLLGKSDAALLERIKRDLAPLRALGPQTLVAIPKDRVGALVDAVIPPVDADSVLNDLMDVPSLAALAQLTRVKKNLDESGAIRDAILLHVRTLSDAHLPSLALAFLQILWDRFALPQALPLLVDLALDHDMLHVLPDMPGTDEQSLQLQTYLLVRAQLANFNTVAAKRVLEAVDAHPAVRDSKDAALLLVRAELAMMEGQSVSEPVAKVIGQLADVGWRYACRVNAGIAMQADPTRAPALVDEFVIQFGEDPYIWAQACDHDEVRAAMLPLLSREVRYASHDPDVWRAVSLFLENEELGMEIDQRQAAQLASVFA